jgi:hypothetical protein
MLKRKDSSTVSPGAGLQFRWFFRHCSSAYIRVTRTLLIATACGLLPACAATPTTSKPDDAYAKAAWAYFKMKCDTEAGEKIYKTFTGVKSVLIVKPLPPATEKDLFDQYWYGDPYSNATPIGDRGESAARWLSGNMTVPYSLGKEYSYADIGFDFIEQRAKQDGASDYERVFPKPEYPFFTSRTITKPSSRFGISWEDISSQEDRKYWVAGSRLKILDLLDNSVVAERIGFLIEPGFGSTTGHRTPWQTARRGRTSCPQLVSILEDDRLFVLKVLQPIEGKANGK